jgi:hypothetical protein
LLEKRSDSYQSNHEEHHPALSSSATMKFISLTIIIIYTAVLAGIVTAQDPDGMPCDQPGE